MQPSPCKEFMEVFVCIQRLLRTMEVRAAVGPICLVRIAIQLTSATLGFIDCVGTSRSRSQRTAGCV